VKKVLIGKNYTPWMGPDLIEKKAKLELLKGRAFADPSLSN